MQNWGVIAGSIVALTAVLVSLALLYARMVPAVGVARSIVLGVVTSLPGAIAWLILAPIVAPSLVADLLLPVAALGALASFLACLGVRSLGARVWVVLAFGVVWSCIVFVPVALMSFAGLGPLGLEPVDHGGSLAFNVAAGAAVLGVLLAGGSKAPRPKVGTVTTPAGVIAVVVLSAAWIGWLVGAELAIDDVTPSIIVNGIAAALGGIAGWLVVQRILHQSTTVAAVAAGLMSGLISVAAAAPLFTPVSAAAAGVLSSAAACYYTLRRVTKARRQQWFIVGTHLMAGGLGVVLLGLLATDMGFLFTGQISLIQEQIASSLVVTVYSTGVAFLLWLALKRVPSVR